MKLGCELRALLATALMKKDGMPRASWTGRLMCIITCALALLTLVPCPQAMAQSASRQPPFRSFCGFKAGDEESKCKTGSRTNKALAETFVRARTPFRKFKDVQLTFQDGKLTGVSAYVCIDNMKPPAAKKELEDCCKELTKRGIKFPADWDVAGSKYQKEGTGDGVSVQLQGDVESTRYVSTGKNNKAVKCAVFSVDVNWSLLTVQSQMSVKQENYSGKSGITRREFIERCFGVKFGEPISKYVKTGKQEAEMVAASGLIVRGLSAPVCDRREIRFEAEKKIRSLELLGKLRAQKVKNADVAKASIEKSCKLVEKWLESGPLEIKEKRKDGETLGFTAEFVDDGCGIRVIVENYIYRLPTGEYMFEDGCITCRFVESEKAPANK